MYRRQNANFKETLCIYCLLQTNEGEFRKRKESGLQEDKSNIQIRRIDFILACTRSNEHKLKGENIMVGYAMNV